MTSPRHLWSGRWQEESEAARDAAPADAPVAEAPAEQEPATVAAPSAEPSAAAPPPRKADPEPSAGGRRSPLRPVALILAALCVVAGAAVAIALLNDGDGGSKTASEQTLPASTTPAPAPKNSSVEAVSAAALPSVAAVRTTTGEGSGFLVRDNRTLVTNAHVVEGATRVTVQFGSSGRQLRGRVRGRDESSDLAVVQILDTPPTNAKPLRVADSDQLKVGQEVVAIGNPFGLAGSVTEGVISALNRSIQSPTLFSIEGAIQTDAAINHGNSGGPLLDTAGRVIGVNSQIETGGTSQGNVGVGFAVPSNIIRRVVPVLAAGKDFEHAWLGIAGPNATATGEAPTIINAITAGGPAANAGLHVGDTITSVNGREVSQFSDVVKAIDGARPGDKVEIKVRRAGAEQTFKVTLGTRPTTQP